VGDVISDTPEGSNNFQDGEAFLRNHGKRGPQTAILAPGTAKLVNVRVRR